MNPITVWTKWAYAYGVVTVGYWYSYEELRADRQERVQVQDIVCCYCPGFNYVEGGPLGLTVPRDPMACSWESKEIGNQGRVV